MDNNKLDNYPEPTQTQPTQPNTQLNNANGDAGNQKHDPLAGVLVRLIVTKGKLAHPNIDLLRNENKSLWVFGRSPHVDKPFGISTPRLSGKHFRIWYSKDNNILIQDLSTNGTFVNNSRIEKGKNYLLTQGDEIAVGIGVPEDIIRFIVVIPPQRGNINIGEQQLEDDGLPDIAKDYIIRNEIVGQGAFATVKKAIERISGETFAVKIIAKRKLGMDNKKGVIRELDILKRLDHPNIIKLKGFYEDKDFYYLVMEFVSGGDLMDLVAAQGAMTEDVSREIIRQTLNAIKYVHGLGISHRDLKPDNILIASDDPVTVKITDFGLAKIGTNNHKGSFLKTFCGTLAYVAPEIIAGKLVSRNKQARKSYSSLVDMWSLGCLCYVILTAHLPFSGETQEQLFKLIKNGAYHDAPLNEYNLSDNLKHFIDSLLQVDPNKRLTAEDALRHPWIINDNIDDQDNFVSLSQGVEDVLGNDTTNNVIPNDDEDNDEDNDENNDNEDGDDNGDDDNEAEEDADRIEEEGEEQEIQQKQDILSNNADSKLSDLQLQSPFRFPNHQPEATNSKSQQNTKIPDDVLMVTEPPAQAEIEAGSVFAKPFLVGDHGADSIDTEVPPTGTYLTLKPLNHSISHAKIHVPQSNKPFVIGRNNKCNYKIDDSRLSKFHCILLRKRHPIGKSFFESPAQGLDDIWLIDYSTNGCHINGKKIGKGKKTLLKSNDQVLFFLDSKNKEFLGFKVQINDMTGLFIDDLKLVASSNNAGTAASGTADAADTDNVATAAIENTCTPYSRVNKTGIESQEKLDKFKQRYNNTIIESQDESDSNLIPRFVAPEKLSRELLDSSAANTINNTKKRRLLGLDFCQPKKRASLNTSQKISFDGPAFQSFAKSAK